MFISYSEGWQTQANGVPPTPGTQPSLCGSEQPAPGREGPPQLITLLILLPPDPNPLESGWARPAADRAGPAGAVRGPAGSCEHWAGGHRWAWVGVGGTESPLGQKTGG